MKVELPFLEGSLSSSCSKHFHNFFFVNIKSKVTNTDVKPALSNFNVNPAKSRNCRGMSECTGRLSTALQGLTIK